MRPSASAGAVMDGNRLVVNGPGSTSTASMPVWASSMRSAAVYPSSAHLLAWYTPKKGSAQRPAVDETFTTRPRPAARIAGRNARRTRCTPTTLMSSCRAISSGENASVTPPNICPALLTTASGAPQASRTSRAAASTEASEVTSRSRTRRSRPPARGDVAEGAGGRGVLAVGRAHRRGDAVAGAGEGLGEVEAEAGAAAGDDDGLRHGEAQARGIRASALCRGARDSQLEAAGGASWLHVSPTIIQPPGVLR